MTRTRRYRMADMWLILHGTMWLILHGADWKTCAICQKLNFGNKPYLPLY